MYLIAYVLNFIEIHLKSPTELNNKSTTQKLHDKHFALTNLFSLNFA